MMEHQARKYPVEIIIPAGQIKRHAFIKRNLQPFPFHFIPGDLKNLPVTVNPDHFRAGLRLLDEDGKRCRTASKVEHPVALFEPSLLHQTALEHGLSHGPAHERIIQRSQPVEGERRDIFIAIPAHVSLLPASTTASSRRRETRLLTRHYQQTSVAGRWVYFMWPECSRNDSPNSEPPSV